MANDVDSRIVEMQFDGKDFDKGIRQSQKNLEDFKKSLSFDDVMSGFQMLALRLDTMSASIDSLAKNAKKMADEMTGFGRISSYIAKKIQSAWKGALGEVEKFTKSMTSDQIDEGSKKYDKLLKSVQTIRNATGDSEETVYAAMEKLNKYTDETSYNFSDMAQNIGKFTTAGVNLADAETEMEGIANWAALAGQGVNEAQRAMYNISQAMSAGYMKLIDYKSIQNANMDIRKFRQEALDAAVAAGTLKKAKDGVYKTVKGGKQVTLENFTETLQYKWFNKKTMETVFKTFADNEKGIGEEAYKAAQRCVTFTDAINAWKDMLSTGWMKSYEHVFGKLSDAMALFSGVCNKVTDSLSTLVKIRNDILAGWSEGGGRDSLWGALFGEIETPDGETLFKGAYGILDAIQDIMGAIREAFWDFIGNFISPLNKALYNSDSESEGKSFLAATLMDLSARLQEFTGKIKDFLHSTDGNGTESRLDRIKAVAQAVFAAVKLVIDIFKGIFNFTKELVRQLSPAITAVEQLISFLLQMFTGSVVQGAKQNAIGNFFHGLAEILKPVTTVINIVVKALASLIARVVATAKQSGILSMFSNGFKTLSGILMDLVVKFINSGVFQKIFGWIQTGISKLPALIQKIKDLGSVLMTTFKNSKVLSGIKGFFSKIFGGKNLGSILDNVKNGIKGLIKKIPEVFNALKSSDIFSKISGFFGNLLSAIFGISSAKADELDGTETLIANDLAQAVAKPIEELGKNDVIGKAIDKAKPGFLQNLKTKLKELWDSITGFFTNIASSDAFKKIGAFFSGTNFQNLLSSAKDILKWLAIFRAGSGLVSAGKGLKSLGKGIKVFGKNLKNLNLSNIFSNMFNISNIINSNNTDNSKHTNFENLGNSILKIAGAIAMVAASAFVLAKLKPDELKQAGISLAIIIGALVGASFLAKKFSGNGGTLLALAMAVLVLLVPLKILQKMVWGDLLDGAGKLAALVLLLAIAGGIAGNVKMKGFVGLALAITLLLIPLKALMKMPILGDNGQFGGLVQGIAAITVLLFVMAGAARLAGGNKMKGMFSLAAALTVLLIPIKTFVNMTWGDIARGVVPILAIIAAITIMIKMTAGIQVGKLAGIVGAIAVLSAVGWLIGHTMDWKQALIGFAPMILLIASLAILFKQASKLSTERLKAVKTIFIMLAVVVGAIAASITVLSTLGVGLDMAITFFAGMILLIASVGVMLKLASKTDSKGIGKTALVLGLMSLLVAIAGGALVDMAKQKIDWKVVAAFTAGLALLVAAIGEFLPKLAKLDLVQGIKGIALLALAVVAIMGAIALMAPVVIGSIGDAMASLAAKMKLMGGLFQDFFSSVDGISEESIKHAAAVFDGIKEIVEKFAGFGTFEKDLRSVLTQLNYLGAGLDAFFLNEAKYPDPENSKAFATLNKLVEMSSSLSAFSVGNLPSELMYLGVGLMLFNEATKDITTADVPALALLQGIFGQSDNISTFTKLPLDTFRSQMSGLGGAMSLYAKGAKEVTGIKADDDAPDITEAIGILKAVCDSLSGEDGSGEFKIPQNMPDEQKLGLFAGQLSALADALSKFAAAAKDMETDTSKALALLGFLAQIGGYITSENLAVFDAFPDDMHVSANGEGGKLGQFSLDIGALGTALSTFAQNVGGKESEFSTGLSVLRRLQTLNSLLTADRLAFVSAFDNAFGDTGGDHTTILGDFANDIGALGHALGTFASNVQVEGKPADFTNALSALDFLAHLQIKLSAVKLDGLAQLIEGNSATLGTLAINIESLGGALADFSKAITGGEEGADAFNAEAVLATMDTLQRMIGVINAINIGHAGEWSGITDKAGELIQFFSILFDENAGPSAFVEGSFIRAFAKFAQDLMTVFNETKGIDPDVISIWQKLMDGIASLVLVDTSLNFKYPGEMMAEGLAQGIESGRSRVVQAAVDVMTAAIEAAKATGVIESPSKVFTEMGEYLDAGLVKGLYGEQDKVEKAGADTMQSVLDSAANVMALISQAMAEELDMQPTITPVLDLSNVMAAGSTLDSLFNGYALNLGNALERAALASSRSGPSEVIVQNPVDLSGIQGSITALQNDIIGLQTAIRNMKIVLNTGVVAGGMTDDIDRNLGTKNLYASRRN